LLYLFQNKQATRTDLRENIEAHMETIYSALDDLTRLGLIEERKSTAFPYTKTVYLTKKGIGVAQRLDEIEEMLREE